MAFLDLPGQRIYYEVTGQGPALILLHSLGFHSGAWREQVKALAPNYTVITPDTRGHGRSPYQQTVTVKGIVDDLEALIDHLKLERFDLLGISMGGLFSLTYYQRHPEKVRSLILADGYASLGEAGQKRVADADKRWAAGIDMAAFAREYVADCLMPIASHEAHEELTAAIAGMLAQAYLDTMRAIYLADVLDILPQVRVPALIIAGDKDHRIPPNAPQVMVQGIAGARLVTLPGAGHLSNLDSPEAFNRTVLDFLHTLPKEASTVS